MKQLQAFQNGDGAHCGLSDWYEDGEAELKAALTDHAPFDTGWYSSKKEIASARIRSEDGVTIDVEVSVSDDFDTEGRGCVSTQAWTLSHVADAIGIAWDNAESDRDENQEYEGFRVGRGGRWEETYLINIGWSESVFPPGDNYHWWGWQCDCDSSDDTVGVPHPDIPVEIVQAFEKWAADWAFGRTEEKSLTIGEWTITPWRENRPQPKDPSDYAGMGWVGQDGRP